MKKFVIGFFSVLAVVLIVLFTWTYEIKKYSLAEIESMHIEVTPTEIRFEPPMGTHETPVLVNYNSTRGRSLLEITIYKQSNVGISPGIMRTLLATATIQEAIPHLDPSSNKMVAKRPPFEWSGVKAAISFVGSDGATAPISEK